MNKKKPIILISFIVILSVLVCIGVSALSGNQTAKVADKLELGEKYMKELEYEKALAVYKEILKIDPQNVEAYLGMADVYMAYNEYEEAMKILEEGYNETGDERLKVKKSEVESLLLGTEEDLASTFESEVTETSTATPEPTLAPIEWTTEEGTLLPTELIVIVKGSPVKLPCTVSEYMERTGEKIFKSDIPEDLIKNRKVYALFDNWELGFYVPDDAESFKDYIIFRINTSNSMCDENHFTDITLPGDIHLGSQYTSWEDLDAMYGLCDAPDVMNWWNVESDNPGFTFDWETGAWTTEERLALSRGYGIYLDGSYKVNGLDIKVSDDKLKELYGN